MVRSSPKLCLADYVTQGLETKTWRRGFLSSKRWERQAPDPNQPDTVMKRYQHHADAKVLPYSITFKFHRVEKQMAQKTKQFLRRRAKYARVKQANADLNDDSEASTSSSSTSSCSSPSG